MCFKEEDIIFIKKCVMIRDDIFDTFQISSTNPYVVDYKERLHLYGRSSVPLLFALEDIGHLSVPANTWVMLPYLQGMRLTPIQQTSTILFSTWSTDRLIIEPVFPATTKAEPPFSGNPTQTASAAADTLYKFGVNSGLVAVNHVSLQNNTSINILYAFDEDTTVSTNQIYVLAPGVYIWWDRSVSVLHFSSASQQNFNGSGGVTVEGFI